MTPEQRRRRRHIPATLTATPNPVDITAAAGASHTAQLVPIVEDSFGTDVTSSQQITYTSSDATKATVSNTGLVTGVAVGTCNITISVLGKSLVVPVTVS